MAADILGRRMDADVGAVVEGPEQVRGAKGIVDDQRDTIVIGDTRHCLEVDDVDVGVADGLDEHGTGLIVDGPTEVLGIDGIDQRGLNAMLGKGIGEEIEGAAIERLGGDDLLAGVGNIENGVGRRGRAGCHRERATAALQRRNPVFQHLVRWVGDPGVVEAELLDRTDRLGLLEVLEDEGSRLVDGHGARAGGGIGCLARMELQRVEFQRSFAHETLSSATLGVKGDGPAKTRSGWMR